MSNSNLTTAITVADIEKLALLSRLELTAEEKTSFANDIGNILAYVGQIQEVAGEVVQGVASESSDEVEGGQIAPTIDRLSKDRYAHKNIMREDVSYYDLGGIDAALVLNPDPQILVESAPRQTVGYIQVKKIIGGSE